MGWVRRHTRHGAWLALAALALQLALSFGHVHLDGVARAVSHGAIAGTHKVVAAQASEPAPAQNPGDDDDYCAICASMFLVATSFVSQPPQLPVPNGFTFVTHSVAATHSVLAPRRFAFQSRAPPAA